jgi:hypothetical protein
VIAACTNACLPHLLRNGTSQPLFREIASVFCETLCSSNDRMARSLAFEPLYSLYATALDTKGCDFSFLAEHFAACALSMSEKCGYPDGYFDHLDLESDHDLEVERNDVRDLIRTVSCSREGGSTSKVATLGCPSELSVLVLRSILKQLRIDNETSLHAFSALAKAANHLAMYCSQGEARNKIFQDILVASMDYMTTVNKLVLSAFAGTVPPQTLIPMSRIASIMNSSFSPFLSSMATFHEITTPLDDLLDLILQTSLISLEQLPELAAPSILPHSSYDIRGTMRGPGGEDHVGCLAIMRLVSESTLLTGRLMQIVDPYTNRLEALYFKLKELELKRGVGIQHGIGVAPQTRRIFLGTICRMEIKLQVLINKISQSTLSELSSYSSAPFGAAGLHRLTELTLDLAAFPSAYVTGFLSEANGGLATKCLEELTHVCLAGYETFAGSNAASDEDSLEHVSICTQSM